ncbi:hypothetical protein C4J81_03625 [Deltaproteobacteria bacterium Smac51]|nr:hypothetical protein C4J81_03625 [Deltaproteobacteria bacterium Smac51]
MRHFPQIILLAGAVITALCLFPSMARAQRDYMEPVQVSPTRLVDDYKANFHEADAKYTGKLLILTGRLKNIHPRDRTYNRYSDKIYSFITLDAGPHNQPVAVYFWDWEAEKMHAMKTGSTVSVMGFCQGVLPQLSIIEACLYPSGCGGPVPNFTGPHFKLPPSDPPRRRR